MGRDARELPAGLLLRRRRVLNGKRTDLSKLLIAKVERALRSHSLPQLFQGHTRFATSSICNLSGCHPHQWLPRRRETVWRWCDGKFVGEQRIVECYITHNGDLDFFQINGITYPLGDVQASLRMLASAWRATCAT